MQDAVCMDEEKFLRVWTAQGYPDESNVRSAIVLTQNVIPF